MQRFGRLLRLKEGVEEEYERYHRAVWPGVLEACARAGIRNYSIFRYRQWLFSYFELPDGVSLDDADKVTGASSACQQWETIMHRLQEPLPESGKENWWVPMREAFHFQGQ